MKDVVIFIICMIIIKWLDGGFSSGHKGDGNSPYDFKDYVNNKVDKYNKE